MGFERNVINQTQLENIISANNNLILPETIRNHLSVENELYLQRLRFCRLHPVNEFLFVENRIGIEVSRLSSELQLHDTSRFGDEHGVVGQLDGTLRAFL